MRKPRVRKLASREGSAEGGAVPPIAGVMPPANVDCSMKALVLWDSFGRKKRRVIVNAEKWLSAKRRDRSVVVNIDKRGEYAVEVNVENRNGAEGTLRVDFKTADEAWWFVHRTSLVGVILHWLSHEFAISPVGLLRRPLPPVLLGEEVARRWTMIRPGPCSARSAFWEGARSASAQFYRTGAISQSYTTPDTNWTAGFIWMTEQMERWSGG